MKNIAHYTGKIYPDKTFSIGYVAKKKKGVQEVEYDRDYEQQFDSYSYTEKKYGRTERKEHKFFDRPFTPDRFINSSKSSQKRKSYGSKGITSYGRKAVSNIALLLQKKYGQKRLGFCTATIPNLGKAGLQVVIRKWGEVVRRYFQELHRVCSRKNIRFLFVSCTEIQEKRFVSSGLPYPHLHYIYVCKERGSKKFTISASEMRNIWKRVVARVLAGELPERSWSEINYGASIDAQIVKKSASAYIGKYMSKGCKVVEAMQEAGFVDFPGQWWSASMQCKKMFKNSIIRMDAETANHIFFELAEYLAEGLITWCSYTWVSHEGEEKCFGCSGRMSKKMYEAFLEKD